MNNTPQSEQDKAEALERYLAGLDRHEVYAVSDTPLSREDAELIHFSRQFKAAAQPAQLSNNLMSAYSEQPRARRWTWLIPLPVIGVSVATALVVFTYTYTPAPTQQIAQANTPLVATLTDAQVTQELLQIEVLDAELVALTADLDSQIAEINYYASTDDLENL